MIFFPNCKINLGLSIVAKRDDGFHEIKSVFYPVDLCDSLEIRPSDEAESRFELTGLDIGERNSEDNLCMKALRLLQKDYPQIGNVNMHLHKTIPAFAGLGGGSSDAVSALRLLDFVYSLSLSKDELLKYATSLGSDCAFFVENSPMYVSGRGEVMQKSDLSLKGKSVVLVKPNIRISTKEAYACVRPKPTEVDYEDLPDLRLWKDVLKNDFEDSLFPKYPVLSEIKQMLYDNGALYASLSGSGATVFGIFEKEIDLERLKQGNDTFIWQGVLR
ncbi:MAG: 4-(cytidine 5'-diphospho)-2-C-methyl-D-erythritol kinase [Bacteroidales bacterium]|nr:4-(cytidine 5'-diphospho)-2-C-methyl-D-erythritol kinase [Bacteroidales bacterium]MEE0976662.1 4-(cytidine 5'-diphospho)-2-C-methyl-D-erythritol kinase [Bacteroidales bacterium]